VGEHIGAISLTHDQRIGAGHTILTVLTYPWSAPHGSLARSSRAADFEVVDHCVHSTGRYAVLWRLALSAVSLEHRKIVRDSKNGPQIGESLCTRISSLIYLA
jgi:hypothetical protein